MEKFLPFQIEKNFSYDRKNLFDKPLLCRKEAREKRDPTGQTAPEKTRDDSPAMKFPRRFSRSDNLTPVTETRNTSKAMQYL